MKIKILSIIILYTLFQSDLVAQSYPIDTRSVDCAAELEKDVCTTISELVAQAFYTYTQRATLIDPENQKVSTKSINAFCKLFDDGKSESIYDDISTGEQYIKAVDYGDKVYFYDLKKVGIKFEIESAVLEKITYDSYDEVYFATLKVVKVLYNGLDANGRVMEYKNGNRCAKPYEFKYTISKDLKRTRIAGLNNKCSETVVTESAIGVYGLMGIFSGASATASNNQLATSFNNANGFGLLYRTNFSSASPLKERLFVEIGGELFKTKLEATTSAPIENSYASKYGEQDVVKQYKLNSYVETADITNLNLSIGLAYRMVNADKLKVDLAVAVLPSFNMSSASSLAYDVTYQNVFSQLDWVMDGEFFGTEQALREQYLVGDFADDQDSDELEINSGLAFRIGPRFILPLGEKLGVNLFIGYTKSFSTLFSEDSTGSSSMLDQFDHTKLTNTLLQSSENVQLDYLTISFGLFLMKNKEKVLRN